MNTGIRRSFLINRPFQLRIIGLMMGMALAPISAFFAAHYYFFWKLRTLGEDVKLDPGHVYFRFIEGQSQQLLLIFLLCTVIAIIVVCVIGLLVSHKVAGPIHRLKSHLSSIAEGAGENELSFRKDDFFTEVPPLVNAAVKKLKGRQG